MQTPTTTQSLLPLKLRSNVHLAGVDVTLADVVDLDTLTQAERQVVGRIVLFRLNARKHVQLKAGFIIARVRGLIPALRSRLPAGSDSLIRFDRVASLPTGRANRPCLVAREVIAAGSVVGARQFARSSCPAGVPNFLRYDAGSGSVRTLHQLEMGDVIPSLSIVERQQVDPGQAVLLRTAVGPIVVERQMRALQPGVPGRKLFAASADGEVVSVPLEGGRP
jgi:hypothetical protein